jgi:hypothetical protein
VEGARIQESGFRELSVGGHAESRRIGGRFSTKV